MTKENSNHTPSPFQNGTPQTAKWSGEKDIPLTLIDLDPNQVRFEFDDEALNQLAQDLEKWDNFSPIIVTPVGDRYLLVCGERRYKAAVIAKFTHINARYMRTLDPSSLIELRLLENQRHKRLTRYEVAFSVCALLKLQLNISQVEISGVITKFSRRDELDTSTSAAIEKALTIAGVKPLTFRNKFLGLMNLDQDIQQVIRERKLSEQKGLIIQGIPDLAQRAATLESALSANMTERQLEAIRRSAVQSGVQKPSKHERLVTKTFNAIGKKWHELDDEKRIEVEALMRQLQAITGVTV